MALMQTNVLNTNEILARRDLLLHRPLETVLLPATPTGIGSWGSIAKTRLHDLDPVARSIIVFDSSRSFGDVNKPWAGVLDFFVVEYLEAEFVASFDRIGWNVASLGSFVAAQVVGVHQLAWDGRVVRVGVLAYVRILSSHGLAVDDQDVEDIVSGCRLCGRQKGD
jgi:hypothetical protein